MSNKVVWVIVVVLVLVGLYYWSSGSAPVEQAPAEETPVAETLPLPAEEAPLE